MGLETSQFFTMASAGPKQLSLDITPKLIEIKALPNTKPEFILTTQPKRLFDLKLTKFPEIITVFGPFCGDYETVENDFAIALESHAVRCLVYMDYITNPINKIVVY